MEVFASIGGFIAENLAVLLQFIGGMAALSTLTPNNSDDKIVQWIYDFVNFTGGNVGKAKNAPGE